MSEPREMQCRACGEPIRFIKSAKNQRNIPCDPDEQTITLAPGTMVVTPDGQVLRGNDSTKNTSVVGYTSHFATCPAAGYFRR